MCAFVNENVIFCHSYIDWPWPLWPLTSVTFDILWPLTLQTYNKMQCVLSRHYNSVQCFHSMQCLMHMVHWSPVSTQKRKKKRHFFALFIQITTSKKNQRFRETSFTPLVCKWPAPYNVQFQYTVLMHTWSPVFVAGAERQKIGIFSHYLFKSQLVQVDRMKIAVKLALFRATLFLSVSILDCIVI